MKPIEKVVETWSKLPPWAKGLVAIGGSVLAYMGIQAGIHHLQAHKEKQIAKGSGEGEDKKDNGPDLRMY